MKKIYFTPRSFSIVGQLVLFLASVAFANAQVITISNPKIIQMKLERGGKAVRDVPERSMSEKALNRPRIEHENASLENKRPSVNPNALPKGEDEAAQKNYPAPNTTLTTSAVLTNWSGLTSNSYPSDNTLTVGPNHVVQLVNGSGSSTFMRIWNKAGVCLDSLKLVQDFTGHSDYGDPNVIYDQQADRFAFVTLYSFSGKKLMISVSQTGDPRGAWNTYTFGTPNGFPDYPKLGVWGNSYFITTNSYPTSIWALDRTTMLAGGALPTVQLFELSNFPGLGFQSASPVSQTGAIPPPPNSPATIIRVADDAWDASIGPDHLELFSLSIDWTTPANSTITGPINLSTIAYNSNLCGFGNYCIPQPGTSTKLDPMTGIVMDKVQYRNFGGRESIVCSHVCNAGGGTNVAGVRWYELRRDANPNWYIYQQSTFTPTIDSRFMSGISMNDKGTIALGYNISSSTIYPGIRVTGRDSCDALNMMTVPEAIAKSGTTACTNTSSRYGDYNGLVTDPSDGSFWMTGNYNITNFWSTNVVHFKISNQPPIAVTGDSVYTGTATTYQWYNSAGSIGGANSQYYIAPVSGYYHVCAGDVTGCMSCSDSLYVLVTGISNSAIAKHELKLFPNPTTGNFEILFSAKSNSTLAVDVYDAAGKNVFSNHIHVDAGENKIPVSTQQFSKGIYLVKILDGEKLYEEKLIVE